MLSRIDSDLNAVLNEEASDSNRTAGLQTLARDLIAAKEIETTQLCAIGEQRGECRVTHTGAIAQSERFELAAAFGHLDQARIAQPYPI